MKKFMSFLLAVLLTLSFTACQQNSGGTVATTGAITAVPTTTPTATIAGNNSGQPTETHTPISEVTQNVPQITTPTVTQSVAPGETQTPIKPTNTPVVTPLQSQTQATQKPTTTVKPAATPTKAPTTKPENTYSPVSGLTIANDKVATEISLDSKVPQNLKAAYNTVKNGFSKENVSRSGEKTVKFSPPISKEELFDVIYYVEAYNPQLFYVNWNDISYSTRDGKVMSVTLNCTSAVSQYAAVENKVNQLVAEANKKPNLFERELYIHDWLVKNIKYDKTTENCANIYGALIEGKALCEGYSRAFQYLMNKIGIETVLITGYAGEAHMWNMVKLYGDYYFVDVTHDDPLPDQAIADGKEYLTGHSCFNVPAKVLEKTHTIDARGSKNANGFLRNTDLQSCTATTYGYYYVKGLAVSNMSEFKSVLYANKSLQTAEVFFTGTMPSMEEVKAAFAAFMKETYPGKGYKYNYTSETSSSYKRNVIRFSWTIK